MTNNPLAIISTVLQKLPPNVRMALYLLGFGIALLTPWLASRGILDEESNTLLLSIAGVLTSGLAGLVLGGQKNTSPADQVASGVDQLNAQEQALQEQKQRATDALSSLVKDVPVVGPVLSEAAKQAADRILRR